MRAAHMSPTHVRHPEITIPGPAVGLMLFQRLRRWTSIRLTSGRCLVLGCTSSMLFSQLSLKRRAHHPSYRDTSYAIHLGNEKNYHLLNTVPAMEKQSAIAVLYFRRISTVFAFARQHRYAEKPLQCVRGGEATFNYQGRVEVFF